MELWIILGVGILLAIIVAGMYNGMVRARNTYQNALSQIDVSLKQRHDMIPQLVETVKGAANFEQETLDKVIQARAGAEKARQGMGNMPSKEQIGALAAAETKLEASMMNLFALAEAYPDLKATQNFSNLQDEISRIEDKISASRRGYNLTVLEYNNKIQVFPNNIIAGMFRFSEAHELEFEDKESFKTPPPISFN